MGRRPCLENQAWGWTVLAQGSSLVPSTASWLCCLVYGNWILCHPVRLQVVEVSRREENASGILAWGFGNLEVAALGGRELPCTGAGKQALTPANVIIPKRHVWLSKTFRSFDENQPVHASGICWLALLQPTCSAPPGMKFPAEPGQIWGS